MTRNNETDDDLKFLQGEQAWPRRAAQAARRDGDEAMRSGISSHRDAALRAQMRSARPVPFFRRADFLLGLILFVWTSVWLVFSFTDIVYYLKSHGFLRFIYAPLAASLGGMLYIYFRRATDPLFRWKPFQALHALPALSTLGALMLVQVQENALLFILNDVRAVHAAPEVLAAARSSLSDLHADLLASMRLGPSVLIFLYAVFLLPFAARRAEPGFLLRGILPFAALFLLAGLVLLLS